MSEGIKEASWKKEKLDPDFKMDFDTGKQRRPRCCDE